MFGFRLFMVVAVLALGLLVFFTIQAATANPSAQAALPPSAPAQGGGPVLDSASVPATAQAEKAREVDQRYRALYPQAFAAAEAQLYWQAMQERLRALYPQAFADAASGGYWKQLEAKYRALYPQAFRDAEFQEHWREVEEGYRKLYPDAFATAAAQQH